MKKTTVSAKIKKVNQMREFEQKMKSSTRLKFLPFALPDIDETEFHEVKEVLQSGWVTTGPKTKQFELEFAKAVGAKHAIAVNSCTATMHLALEAVGVQCGDEVIRTPYTFAATAEVIWYFDAKPVFVDVDPRNLNMIYAYYHGNLGRI